MHTETSTTTPEAITPAAAEPTRFQCRHIKTDGLRCRSACLRHEQFCYFHHTTRVPLRNPRDRKAALSKREAFDLPLVEDRPSIQLAIAHILQRIAANSLDPRRAGLLLYGLQIASVNLPPQDRRPDRKAPAQPDIPIEETVQDPTHGTLAPIAEIGKPVKTKDEWSLYEILMDQWEKDKHLYDLETEAARQLCHNGMQPSDRADDSPSTLHHIQACAPASPAENLSIPPSAHVLTAAKMSPCRRSPHQRLPPPARAALSIIGKRRKVQRVNHHRGKAGYAEGFASGGHRRCGSRRVGGGDPAPKVRGSGHGR